MRLKSAIWVAAYVRRCNIEGAFAAVRHRGAEEAGAIFVKLNRLDGTAELFGPAPQSAFDEAHPLDRAFSRCLKEQPAPAAISWNEWLPEPRPSRIASLPCKGDGRGAGTKPSLNDQPGCAAAIPFAP